MKQSFWIFAVGVLLTAAAGLGQSSQKPVSTAEGIDVLRQYTGSWKAETDHLNTPYSKAHHESHELRNDCWESGAYFACRQIVDGDPKILLVFTYSLGDKTYETYQIPAHGGEAGQGKLLIDGNTWTFPWSISEGGKTVYFRVVNVWSSPTTIEFRQEYSMDRVNWTRMATGHTTKIAKK